MTVLRPELLVVGGLFVVLAAVTAWRAGAKRRASLVVYPAVLLGLAALTVFLPPLDHIVNNGMVTPEPLAVMQWLVSCGFFMLGTISFVDWARHRGKARLALAGSLVLLGALSLFGQVWMRVTTAPEPSLPTLILLLASGYSFFLFRITLIPARRATFWTVTGCVLASVAAGVLLPAQNTRTTQVHYTPAQLAALLFIIGTWAYTIGDPCVRLWLHSRQLPAVQRMRARYLAAGYGGIIAILVVTVALVLVFSKLENSPAVAYVLEVVVMLSLPLMYVALLPPAWMRRFWRETEEEAFRLATHKLLLGQPDAEALARQCLEWAVRLVGAEAGCIVGLDGELLATSNLSKEQALMLAGASHHAEGRNALRLEPTRIESNVIVVPMKSALGSGAIAVVAGNFTPLLGSDEVNRLTQYAASVTAAFDRLLLLGQLSVARDSAERATRRKTDHLSRMSHELRTPMSAILGFADLLALNDPRPDQKEDINAIMKAADHLLALINEILEISLIESGSSTLSLEPVDLNSVVEESVTLVGRRAAMSNIRIVKSLPTEHTYVIADNQRLRQVMVNLLSNAVKYNRVDGSVTIKTEDHNGSVRVEVTDTGEGLDPAAMDRLFEPFQRMGKENSDVEGTGLGLALSKALVEAMHGTMGVETHPGVGSTFWFEVTRTEKQAAQSDDIEITSTEYVKSSGYAEYHDILYVEDNLANVELADRVLSQERPHLHLIPVSTGQQALDYLEEHHPGMVLLDLHLGDINGDEVLRQIRASNRLRDMTVVMLSADASNSQVERLMAMGANEYLTKPFRVKTLLRAVDEGLQGLIHSSRLTEAEARQEPATSQ